MCCIFYETSCFLHSEKVLLQGISSLVTYQWSFYGQYWTRICTIAIASQQDKYRAKMATEHIHLEPKHSSRLLWEGRHANTPDGTRTHNPWLRRPVPYPLGHWGWTLEAESDTFLVFFHYFNQSHLSFVIEWLIMILYYLHSKSKRILTVFLLSLEKSKAFLCCVGLDHLVMGECSFW